MKMSFYRDETGSLINLSGACLNVIMGFGYTSAILIYLRRWKVTQEMPEMLELCRRLVFVAAKYAETNISGGRLLTGG